MSQNRIDIDQIDDFGTPKNFIINGAFDFWQRGTSLNTTGNSNFYIADRFHLTSFFATTTFTLSRQADVPTSSNSQYSFRATVLSVGSDVITGIRYYMEGYDYRNIRNRTATMTFWVKSNVADTYTLRFGAAGNTYLVEYTVDAVDTWEQKTIVVDFDYVAGTDEFENGIGLDIFWTLDTNGAYDATADSWQVGGFFATSNQVDFCDSASNYFQLADVQFELGSSPSSFMYTPFDVELQRCQRYYEKSYALDEPPGSTAGGGNADGVQTVRDATVNGSIHDTVTFAVRKAVDPTVTVYSPVSGATPYVWERHGDSGTVDLEVDGLSVSREGIERVELVSNLGTPSSSNNLWSNTHRFQYVADAEL